MPRNFDRRVEIAFPIEDDALKDTLTGILNLTLSDTVKLRVQRPDGKYEKACRRGGERVHSQLKFHELAVNRARAHEARTESFRPVATESQIEK
jgi:polyphosphate kinase